MHVYVYCCASMQSLAILVCEHEIIINMKS